MKIKFIFWSMIVIVSTLSTLFFRFFLLTNEQMGQSVFYDGPIVQKLEVDKTPASNEGPTPPKGVSEERWNEEFAYKIVGKIKNFDEAAYRAKHPEAFFAPHKDATPSIYTKTIPNREEIGQYKIGLPL